MATLTRTGHPYTSLVPISVAPEGAPVVCISALAEHTQNLRADPRASLLVAEDVPAGVDPLAVARVTLVGSFTSFDPTDDDVARHLDVHPHADAYVHFEDFSWWRFETASVRYVGGFGFMGWASGQEFRGAEPDPVIPHAAPMIEHLNADHADACLEIVRRLAGFPEAVRAVVTGVDRYGMTFDVFEHDAPVVDAVARVAFAEPLAVADEVRAASVALVRQARG
jgi:putative heme iron utilization protein